MTVDQLVKSLMQYNPDAEIVIFDRHTGAPYEYCFSFENEDEGEKQVMIEFE